MTIHLEIFSISPEKAESNSMYAKINAIKLKIRIRCSGQNIADAAYRKTFACGFEICDCNNTSQVYCTSTERQSLNFTIITSPEQIADFAIYVTSEQPGGAWDQDKYPVFVLPPTCQCFCVCMLTVEATTYGTVGSCCCKQWVAIKHGCMRTCFPMRFDCPGTVQPIIDPPPPIEIGGELEPKIAIDRPKPRPEIGTGTTITISGCIFEVLGMCIEKPDIKYSILKSCYKIRIRGRCRVQNQAIITSSSTFSVTYLLLNGVDRKTILFQLQHLIQPITVTPTNIVTPLPDCVFHLTLAALPPEWNQMECPCVCLETPNQKLSLDFAISAMQGLHTTISPTPSNTSGAVLAQLLPS